VAPLLGLHDVGADAEHGDAWLAGGARALLLLFQFREAREVAGRGSRIADARFQNLAHRAFVRVGAQVNITPPCGFVRLPGTLGLGDVPGEERGRAVVTVGKLALRDAGIDRSEQEATPYSLAPRRDQRVETREPPTHEAMLTFAHPWGKFRRGRERDTGPRPPPSRTELANCAQACMNVWKVYNELSGRRGRGRGSKLAAR
jgi:hypothetical protein